MLHAIEFDGTEATPRANTLFETALNATATPDDPGDIDEWLANEEPAVLTLCELLIDALLPEQVQALQMIVTHVATRAMQMEREVDDAMDAEERARRNAEDADRRAELCEACRQREDAKEDAVLVTLKEVAALVTLKAVAAAAAPAPAPDHTP